MTVHNPYLNKNEMAILNAMLSNAIAKGYEVSLHDGEETVCKRSTDVNELLVESAATGSDAFTFHRPNVAGYVGWVSCIYNNGNDGLDVISDHTDHAEIEAILETANIYIEDNSN